MNIKRIIYRLYDAVRKTLWLINGSRKQKLFGYDLRFIPSTVLNESIWFHYPKQSARQRIVMYTDYVQCHSMVNYLESITGQPVVVEIGAYHGEYAVLLGKIAKNKNGKLIAVEASKKNADVLRQNVALNKLNETVTVVESFIQDTDGETVSFLEYGSQSTLDITGKGDAVRCEAISTLFKRLDIKKIDLLLIDIEGAEVRLLPALPWSDIAVDRIYCEMHPGEWQRFGSDGSAIEQTIREQHLLCLDMYMQPFIEFRHFHYAGPAVMFRQPCY